MQVGRYYTMVVCLEIILHVMRKGMLLHVMLSASERLILLLCATVPCKGKRL